MPKDERDVDRHLLARDQLLEVDVEDLTLERVALDLADQRRRRPAAVDAELDDRALRGAGAEQPVEVLLVDRERLRIARAPVNDGGYLTAAAKLAGGALAAVGARGGAQIDGCHDTFSRTFIIRTASSRTARRGCT
jgi:hypothetical protein